MEREIRNFINLIKAGKAPKGVKINVDFKKLITLLEKNDGKCPRCNEASISLKFLINGGVLTCPRCEQERRYGDWEKRIPLEQVKREQLNQLSSMA